MLVNVNNGLKRDRGVAGSVPVSIARRGATRVAHCTLFVFCCKMRGCCGARSFLFGPIKIAERRPSGGGAVRSGAEQCCSRFYCCVSIELQAVRESCYYF